MYVVDNFYWHHKFGVMTLDPDEKSVKRIWWNSNMLKLLVNIAMSFDQIKRFALAIK
jgi:hypothetical protein